MTIHLIKLKFKALGIFFPVPNHEIQQPVYKILNPILFFIYGNYPGTTYAKRSY